MVGHIGGYNEAQQYARIDGQGEEGAQPTTYAANGLFVQIHIRISIHSPVVGNFAYEYGQDHKHAAAR